MGICKNGRMFQGDEPYCIWHSNGHASSESPDFDTNLRQWDIAAEVPMHCCPDSSKDATGSPGAKRRLPEDDCDPTLPYRQGVAGIANRYEWGGQWGADGRCFYYDGNGFFQKIDSCCCDHPDDWADNCNNVCEPTKRKGRGWKPAKKGITLGACEGRCTKDEHCISPLKCYIDPKTKDLPPGCTGKNTRFRNFNFCYDEMWGDPECSYTMDETSKTNANMNVAANEGYYEIITKSNGYDARPLIFGGIIGFLTVIMMVVLFVVMRRRWKRKSAVEESKVINTEMVEVEDAPNVVPDADDITNDTAVKEGVSVTANEMEFPNENEVSCSKEEVITPQSTSDMHMEEVQVTAEVLRVPSVSVTSM